VSETQRVTGDPVRLRQVCLNLLDNAVKFTEGGTVRFSAAWEREGEGGTLSLVISDTGKGIDPARQQDAFRRYAAKGGVLARGGAGLGLGLSLTRDLTEMMGGALNLSSQPGEGTTVTVRVPLAAAAPLVRALPDEREGLPERLSASVLIVDDNAPNRMVADALLKLAGAQTILCSNGREAVEAAEAAPFDLILMDISMPVMDGIEATVAIREGDGPNARTPILAVTAHVAREEAAEVMRAGFDEVIHKPVRREVLTEALQRWAQPGRAAPDEGVSDTEEKSVA
jgi:CheY-like chemotaxis protein/anti-sigma regulatory factor (Ser/Thr protein kinase)